MHVVLKLALWTLHRTSEEDNSKCDGSDWAPSVPTRGWDSIQRSEFEWSIDIHIVPIQRVLRAECVHPGAPTPRSLVRAADGIHSCRPCAVMKQVLQYHGGRKFPGALSIPQVRAANCRGDPGEQSISLNANSARKRQYFGRSSDDLETL